MRRTASVLFAAALAFGFAACGDDDDGGGSDTTETTVADEGTDDTDTTEAGDAGDESSSDAVDTYCDAVDEFVDAVREAGGDAEQIASLTEEGQEVAAQAGQLAAANLSEEQLAEAEACSQEASDAFDDLVPQG